MLLQMALYTAAIDFPGPCLQAAGIWCFRACINDITTLKPVVAGGGPHVHWQRVLQLYFPGPALNITQFPEPGIDEKAHRKRSRYLPLTGRSALSTCVFASLPLQHAQTIARCIAGTNSHPSKLKTSWLHTQPSGAFCSIYTLYLPR